MTISLLSLWLPFWLWLAAMVDQVELLLASLMGSITGWRLARETFSWMPVMEDPLSSAMDLSALSTLSYVMNPQFFSISMDILTIWPYLVNEDLNKIGA